MFTGGISLLLHQARQELSQIQKQSSLFPSHCDSNIEGFLKTLKNADISVIGPELVFGKIYDHTGFNAINEVLFRHLVIARLVKDIKTRLIISYSDKRAAKDQHKRERGLQRLEKHIKLGKLH